MSRERSVSPTVALWDARMAAREKMATMVSMGLHVFNPTWQARVGGAMPRGREYSTGFRQVTMKVLGSDETISFPAQTCTRVLDVKEALASQLLVDPDSLSFIEKRGCTSRQMYNTEEMASTVTVRGITTFKAARHNWPHPVCVIGSGYNGLKTLMLYVKAGQKDIVCFDRNDRVGGYCWITAANKTSRLQTEFGAFHLWWGHEVSEGVLGYPEGYDIWPRKAQILEHFQFTAEQYGILPYIRFRSNVSRVEVIGQRDDPNRSYRLTVTPVDGYEVTEVACSVMFSYPGSLTKNRIIDYPGEDVFEGYIGYGMNDDTPYGKLDGNTVAILGNGAFAVENARTCAEEGAQKIYLVTRRKNLASPRLPCWFVHQGPLPTPGRLVLKMFEPMYELAGFGDPWKFWSVHASADRQKVSIIQNSRFGIGDVTFLMVAYGKLEYVQDTLKRCSRHTLHLDSGRKLESVTIILKALGLLGDFTFDRLHKMTKVVGSFCDGDWRRAYSIDATGMNAANFTTFSLGIGVKGMITNFKYLYDHPREFYKLQGLGLMDQLPASKADEKNDKPAYIVDVKFVQGSAIILETMCPKLSELSSSDAEYKYRMYHAAHGYTRFMEEAIKDWDQYQELFQKQGHTHEYITYPYTKEMVQRYFEEYSHALGWPISIDGPPKDAPPIQSGVQQIGAPPPWAQDENALKHVEAAINKDHQNWWMERGSGSDWFKQRLEMSSGRALTNH